MSHFQSPLTLYKASPEIFQNLNEAIDKASSLMLSHQSADGYWWYTLEANESINAASIFLMHYLNAVDLGFQDQLANRIKASQTLDGSWPTYFEGPGDLSNTMECYFALKLSGLSPQDPVMVKAQEFVRNHGGLSQCRIFTRITLAQFGIIPWNACPAMPVWFIMAPNKFSVNIYEFSSWARATIVPLLIILDQKRIHKLPDGFLDELVCEEQISWAFKGSSSPSLLEKALLFNDKILKYFNNLNIIPLRKRSLLRCETWIRKHVDRTEDIFPALANAAMALFSLGYPLSDPGIQKCLHALKKFRIALPHAALIGELPEKINIPQHGSYQQCCVSPVWDTPWMGMALLEAGLGEKNPSLIKAARWLISKQILNVYGDWAVKNKNALAGGWSFEFENDYFPDVDDTIEVLLFLQKMGLNPDELKTPLSRGLSWVLSMQSKNGGWAAFDKDNTKEILNQIPFSDYKACLDQPSADITARMLELLSQNGFTKNSSVVSKAIAFLEKEQHSSGAWLGRWGVNYIYGTWCVLQGLRAIGYDMQSERIQKAVLWLKSIQNEDGGFGESCRSYDENNYVPLNKSTASQTAWALMGLLAAGEGASKQAAQAARFLIETQNGDGSWTEWEHTGTGFPRHFYIRYHGYRHYFPLLALGKYRKFQQAPTSF
ncbi:MAG TPA: squalene--hopene cyclase [Deltaproteobacteria bacterium]|nr:MAG: squalene--hopene cyclase [Deltaproteobacteria bacterium GWA2_45_12]HBF13371.1 squalene--hopene cyclase [Deltaproteobacteria bacterium]